MRPLCLGTSGSVRATSMHHLASWAKVVHTFWPVIRKPPFSATALVFSDARSEPDSGSEKPWHQISSAERIGSRKRSFCSFVPWAITTGPPITRPSTFAGRGAFARASSSPKIDCSIRVAPRPPYSFGHEIPAQPAACIWRCHSRSNSNWAWSPLVGAGPGWFASIHERTSSRNACSSELSVRSTRGKLVEHVEHRQRRPDPGDPGEDHPRVLVRIAAVERVSRRS